MPLRICVQGLMETLITTVSKELLKDAALSKQVVLVMSTHITKIRESLRNLFDEKNRRRAVDTDQAVLQYTEYGPVDPRCSCLMLNS